MPGWEELVIAARAGDRHAFAALVEREGPAAVRLARRILGSAADAEDAAQDAFIRAWRDLPRLRDAGRWPAWFRRLVVRAALDGARRSRRGPQIVSAEVGDPAAPDSTARLAERDRVLQALASLPVGERAVLVLRYGEDLEVPDVADALSIPLGTAKSRIHRALRRLRAQLGDES
ncbi:MAG TPA: sigma-70 family RNA polymerase sigma factor [Candidatus Limnocylindrales bacterium]|nr:sigma-70 family RNA polymerase sigma factor [Candidatus Limnocylindrales bacterium]